MDFHQNPPKFIENPTFGFRRGRETNVVWVARAETCAMDNPGGELSKNDVNFAGASIKSGQPMAPKSKNHKICNSIGMARPAQASAHLLNFRDFSISAPSVVRS